MFCAVHVGLHCLDSHRAGLKHYLHIIHRASYKLPGTGFSHPEKSLLDSKISLNLPFPLQSDCIPEQSASAMRVTAANTSLFCWFRSRDCATLLLFGQLFKKNKCYLLFLDLRQITIILILI